MADRTHLTIGEVLARLRQEFPDVSISKIRFLESQGLVDPERTPSGYRKFYEHDVDRLRWILRQQRENFLPLKVIRGRLTGRESEAGLPETIDVPVAEEAGLEEAVLEVDITEVDITESAVAESAVAEFAVAGAPGSTVEAPGDEEASELFPPHRDAAAGTAAPAPSPRWSRPDPSSGLTTSGLTTSGPPTSDTPADPTDGPAPAPAPEMTETEPTVTEPTSTEAPSTETPSSPAGSPSSEPAPVASRPGPTGEVNGDAARTDTARTDTARTDTARTDTARTDPAPTDADGPTGPAGGSRRRSGARSTPRPSGSPPVGAPRAAAAASEGAASPPGTVEPAPAAATRGAAKDPASRDAYTVAELAEAAGCTPQLIRDLQQFGIVVAGPSVGGKVYFGPEAVVVARVGARFAELGVEPRHLRTWRNAADREASLFEQLVMPMLRQRDPQSRREAATRLAELSDLGAELRAGLVAEAVRSIK